MKLEVLKGSEKGRIYNLDEKNEILIGRDKNCPVCLNDAKSSRHHARIFSENGHTMLEDMGSTNGTTLNGKTIFKYKLCENDEIIIGNTLFLVRELESSASTNSSTSIQIHDGSSTVILSTLPHKEADLLKGSMPMVTADELLLENKNLKRVCEISHLFVTHRDDMTIINQVLQTMLEILAADTACILSLPPNEKNWVTRAIITSTGNANLVQVSRTIIQQALNEGVAVLTSDPLTDARFDPSISIISQGISSAICAPIKVENRFHGVLFFDRRRKTEVFNSMDLRLGATIANILGLFLEKEKLENEARKKERMAVIGEVMAGLAHHTKNILTGLKFSINALEVVVQKKHMDSISKCLKAISAQEKRISDLVLNMLSYSKDRTPVRSEVNLKNLIEDVTGPYQSHFEEKKITFKLNYNEKTPLIQAEEPALHRALLNLLVNTMDSFKNKSESLPETISITVYPSPDQEKVYLEFYDTGCGISPGNLEKLFTIFYSTKGSEGTGLGLAVVQKIIQEHGGHVSVDSQEGKWTKFTLELPVKKD
ncbi:MAG: FHA domain-containing protein [Candidatus Aureabacteria bacterium]|nr:FHA domain-containing protein [Candidatus Auribacterota bacterium]